MAHCAAVEAYSRLMPRYPGADFRPLDRYKPGGSSAIAMIEHNRGILHTAVTSATSLFESMNRPGTPSSHFYFPAVGRPEQYIDTAIRSSANLEGNHDCVTAERQDRGAGFPNWTGSNVPPFNDHQLEEIEKWIVWLNNTHGIPIVRLSSSRPGTRGVGVHRQGINGNFPPGDLAGRVPGGELWSTSTGKACPGDKPIKQTWGVIIPQAFKLDQGIPDDGGSDDMQLSDKLGPGDDAPTVRQALRAAFHVDNQFSAFRANEAKRDKQMLGMIDELLESGADDATKEQIRKLRLLIDQPVEP